MCPQARLEGYASAYLPIPFVFFTNGVADSFIACAILATVHRALVTALVAVRHSDVSFILNPDGRCSHFSYLRLTMHSSAAWFFCISVLVAGGDPLQGTCPSDYGPHGPARPVEPQARELKAVGCHMKPSRLILHVPFQQKPGAFPGAKKSLEQS